MSRGSRRACRSVPGPRANSPARAPLICTQTAAGLVLNATLGWWWGDPAAGYVLVFYAAREVREIFFAGHWNPRETSSRSRAGRGVAALID